MKQVDLFGEDSKEESDYTQAITLPTYTPRAIKPHVLELIDIKKSTRLIAEINNSNLPEEESWGVKPKRFSGTEEECKKFIAESRNPELF